MKHLPPNQQEAIDPSTKPERLRALAKRGSALARKVAQNPNTPTDLLVELSKSADRKTKEGLAKNPSTPPAILLELARLFPEEFMQNPALALLLIEDPTFVQRLPTEAFLSLLSCPEVPEYLFTFAHRALNNPRMPQELKPLRLALAQHPKTPVYLLEDLAHRVQEQGEILALLENPNSAPKVAAILATRRGPPEARKEGLRARLLTREYRELFLKVGLHKKAGGPRATAEDLHTLSELGEEAQRYVARDPNAPAELLARLSSAPQSVCEEIAQHPNTPTETLVQLAEERPSLSWAVAKHPRLPAESLAALSTSSITLTRMHVAQHLDTPPATLAALLLDVSPMVQTAAAKHPNAPADKAALRERLMTPGALPEEEIERFSAHQDHWIRTLVTRHPNLTPAVVERLSRDSHSEVKHALLQNAALASLVDKRLLEDKDFAIFAAGSRTTPPDRMALAQHPEVTVRLALAKNPKISAALLAALLEDPNTEVREEATKNEEGRDIKLLLSHGRG